MTPDIKKMFEDQRIFNRLIWDKDKYGSDSVAVVERLRHLTLGMFEEALEFISTFGYKPHRRKNYRLQNVAHSHEELIDQFKYWLSLADVVDFPMDRLEEMFYAKSRVVQYRWQEEWQSSIDRPCVVVDIDQVLADYVTGLCDWATVNGPRVLGWNYAIRVPVDGLTEITGPWESVANRLAKLKQEKGWLSHESVGISRQDWNAIKHQFRVSGGKRFLPVYDDARLFLEWCRRNGWLIVIITSRPIDEYPNILTDTLTWLTDNQLPYDYVWWAAKKAERLEETNVLFRSQIQFAVDDSLEFVTQFASKGIKTYWLKRGEDKRSAPYTNVEVVRSLTELMERETEHVV